MKLHFLGANRQVTGSRYLLEAGGHEILIDCGMFQEREFQARNWEPSPIPPGNIDAMLLTHAHLDHCGLIPRFVREGFRGPIYCTPPTVPLSAIILQDSAEIQVEDLAYKVKRHAREGRPGKHPNEPLYTVADVERCLSQFHAVRYRQTVPITESLSVTFHDAGQIIGSAMLELLVSENGHPQRVLFSGDIGQQNKPLIRDPTMFTAADFVVMESTYGDRDHEAAGDVETQLADVVQKTVQRGGNVVIPTFAVERAQELIYHISRLFHQNRIPSLPVFLDSPMSVDVTQVFRRFDDHFDAETWALIQAHASPLSFPELTFAHSADESKAINRVRQPCIIMASSGMCNAGRIKHHLRANISRPESTILFVGYQGQGTLGRQILDGQRDVRIHGEMFRVKAQIAQIYGFSGHADRSMLLKWIGNLRTPPKRIFLTHGEAAAAESLASQIRSSQSWPVLVPSYREIVELGS